jgi:acetyl-CoA carboxylase biotin carboxyl carrier protein
MAKHVKDKTDVSDPNGDEHALVAMARGLAEIVAAHGLTELIVDTKETTVTIRRGGTTSHAVPVGMAHTAHVEHHSFAQPPAHAAPVAVAAPVEDKSHAVTSPFVGTFYRKPNPDSPVYVSMGEKVDKGQVLCIVEAMKLMNEIEADVAGTIVAILAEDGSAVEYGQPLFRIA